MNNTHHSYSAYISPQQNQTEIIKITKRGKNNISVYLPRVNLRLFLHYFFLIIFTTGNHYLSTFPSKWFHISKTNQIQACNKGQNFSYKSPYLNYELNRKIIGVVKIMRQHCLIIHTPRTSGYVADQCACYTDCMLLKH